MAGRTLQPPSESGTSLERLALDIVRWALRQRGDMDSLARIRSYRDTDGFVVVVRLRTPNAPSAAWLAAVACAVEQQSHGKVSGRGVAVNSATGLAVLGFVCADLPQRRGYDAAGPRTKRSEAALARLVGCEVWDRREPRHLEVVA
jgi:hypothetical protein